MSKKPLIIWEKWRDPFGEKNSDDIDEEEYIEKDYDDDSFKQDQIVARVLVTPMGIVPYNDNTASSKIFNFWLGHTNFDINQTIFEILEYTEGVETLDIFTRYRFRVGIGKAFDDRKVMRKLNEKIYHTLEKSVANDDES